MAVLLLMLFSAVANLLKCEPRAYADDRNRESRVARCAADAHGRGFAMNN